MAVSNAVLAAMQQTNEQFCNGLIQGKDFGRVDEVYTSGARVLPPGAPMVGGREAIGEFWKIAVEGLGITGATLKTLTAETAGDTVIEIGEAELTLKAGGPVVAKYIVHWKQENGRWLWDKDIWNLNAG